MEEDRRLERTRREDGEPVDGLRRAVAALSERLIDWRRELHRHPELGFDEHRTAAFVATRLHDLGLEVRTGVARTGVVGLLRAPRPGGAGVLLRADMDALPIREVPGRDYGSTVEGRMHACGHDAHVSMLLGAATLLAERRARVPRDVVFCFQPAEEGGGGAARMIEEGVLEWVETGSAYALHVWTPYEVGTVSVRPGPAMAAADEFEARVLGRGGHGALPHLTRDPIVAAAMAIVALQSIVSRTVDPLAAAVVTVGSVQAGGSPNVVPDEARLEGTLRAFDEAVLGRLRERVHEVLQGVTRTAGCSLEYELAEGYPVLVNDPQAVERVRRVALPLFGTDNVRERPPLAASEDFAFFLQRRPGALVLVGAGNRARGITAPHHSPEFDIDESVLPLGTELLVRLALLA